MKICLESRYAVFSKIFSKRCLFPNPILPVQGPPDLGVGGVGYDQACAANLVLGFVLMLQATSSDHASGGNLVLGFLRSS